MSEPKTTRKRIVKLSTSSFLHLVKNTKDMDVLQICLEEASQDDCKHLVINSDKEEVKLMFLEKVISVLEHSDFINIFLLSKNEAVSYRMLQEDDFIPTYEELLAMIKSNSSEKILEILLKKIDIDRISTQQAKYLASNILNIDKAMVFANIVIKHGCMENLSFLSKYSKLEEISFFVEDEILKNGNRHNLLELCQTAKNDVVAIKASEMLFFYATKQEMIILSNKAKLESIALMFVQPLLDIVSLEEARSLLLFSNFKSISKLFVDKVLKTETYENLLYLSKYSNDTELDKKVLEKFLPIVSIEDCKILSNTAKNSTLRKAFFKKLIQELDEQQVFDFIEHIKVSAHLPLALEKISDKINANECFYLAQKSHNIKISNKLSEMGKELSSLDGLL